MSYILDALKKSERERGTRKTRRLLEKPTEAPAASPQPLRGPLRLQYLAAIILLINVSFFVFWLHPWRWAGTVKNNPTEGSQIPEAGQQSAPTIPPPQGAQLNDKKDNEAFQAMKTEPAPGPAHIEAQHGAPRVSAEVKSTVKKPDASKPPRSRIPAETRKAPKTEALPSASEKPALRREQPALPAAGSGIISDMQPLAALGASTGKPSAPKWGDLSSQVRDEIPNLSFSMLIYSGKAEERWISINGSKRREGDEISAGLKLEEITPEGAILSYRGRRFYKAVVGD